MTKTGMTTMRISIAGAVAAFIAAAVLAAQAPTNHAVGRRVLLDAHNAYPYQGRWSDRIDRALATGTPLAIEQDLVWRPATGATPAHSIVSHGEPWTGDEPTLRDFFERIRPIATAALTSASREHWPLITLNLDFKDSHPQHFAAIWDLLGEYEEWLTTTRRATALDRVEPLQLGPVLVLSGSDPAQQAAFHDAVPIGSRLRVFGAAASKAQAATNYHRWSNNPWSVVEPEGQNAAGDWTAEDADRLSRLVRGAHDAGLWIRFYTLNGHSAEHGERMGWTPGYNFRSLDAVRPAGMPRLPRGLISSPPINTKTTTRFHPAESPLLRLCRVRCLGWLRLAHGGSLMTFRLPFFILLAAISFPAASLAQVDRAALTGIVHDSSGAIVPGALVKLTPIAGGAEREVKATDSGAYQITGLASGEWLVEIAAAGFQTVAQTVRLEVGQRAQLDVTLPVGGVTERVLVEGVTPLLDTQSAVLGTVVSEKEIATLPLALRNWDDMLFLVPGVQGYRYTEESGGTSAGRTGGISVHGHRSLQNNFLLDGVDNNSISTNVQELSTQLSRPSIDAIGEFKVVTTPFTAEYGRAPGATISVTTKSGSNALRGSTYYYFRDEGFDANTFFSNRSALPKPTNNQNQFGGSLGGPARRGTAFFFADYEGTRITRGVLRTGTVPTADQRNGVFTSTIRDPQTGQAFANNTIPASRIDPVAAAILAMVPMPNAAGSSNFIRQPDITDDNDRFSGRFDLRGSSEDNIFVRYSYNKRFRFVPGWFGGLLDGSSTSAWGRNDLKSQSAVFGWTKILGPSVVNEFRYAWSQGRSDGYQDPKGEDGMAAIGFTGVPAENRTGGIIGVDIQGLIRIGSPNFMPKYQHTDQMQFIDTMSWLRGPHQFKFGAEITAPMKNDYVDVPATRGDTVFRNNMFTGSALADFMLGYATSVQLSNFHEVHQRQYAYSFFVQDDYRATDRLTLNLGLRYDFVTPQMDAENRVANFDPVTGQLYYGADGSIEDRALVKPDRNNFGPRLGIVYKANPATVIRGGYGIYYNLVERMGSEDQLSLNPPGLRNISITAPAGSATPAFILRNGFPPNYLDVSNINYRTLLLRTAQRDGKSSMFHQFAVGLERQVSTSFVASADVIGSLGRNITLLRNLNQPANGNGARPYPDFGAIQYRDHAGESRYRGVDLSLEKRFSKGHSYRVSYTLGDQRDNTPEHLSAASPRPQNPNDLEAWEAPGDNDIRHRFVGSFIADLPLGRNPILRDWLVASILTAHTGRPFTVTQGSLEGAGWVPNRVADTEGPKTVDQWFNVSDFQVVPAGTFGDAGRNVLRGPGWFTLDFSLQRRIVMTNTLAATLRYDVFNATNRTNFGNPNADVTAANRATITGLAGDPRSMQFSVRLEF